jgi:hypothetical protein
MKRKVGIMGGFRTMRVKMIGEVVPVAKTFMI